MIVTRRRKKKRNLRGPAVFLGVLAVIGFVLGFPPTRDAIANGPLKPAWTAGTGVASVVARPLTFAVQQQTIVDRNRTIRQLDGQLDAERQAKAADDARITQLQQQLDAVANEPKPTPVPAPVRSAAALAGTALAPAPAATPSDDERRLAATWAAMDPEKAAGVIERLPDAEVVRVLAAMDADSAAGILNALPPTLAARLSRTGTQVSATSNR